MPMGDGTFCLGVLKAIQQAAGVTRGDTITVELELDAAPRIVDPPPDPWRRRRSRRRVSAAWPRRWKGCGPRDR